jgi:hypothetical protein
MSKCYASKVIAIALAELGYHEKATNANLYAKTTNSGSNNYTKYANDFDTKYTGFYNGKKNGFAWCDMFVDWCFVTAFGVTEALRLLCQTTGSAGAGCTYSLSYYKKKGQLYTSPVVGDQIFFGTSQSNATHTGLVYKVDSTKVYTIEGNSDDQVAQRSYLLTNATIVGYGRPAYDAEGSTAASSAGTTTSTAKTTNVSQGLSVGDVVTFTGTTHYTSANAATGKTCKPGEAKVTAVSASSKHPYHLIKTTGSASTVYGWVDAADIQTAASAAIVKGSKVKVNSGAKAYTGGALAAFVYRNTYTVLELSGSRAVIGQGSAVTAAVNIKDLTLAG